MTEFKRDRFERLWPVDTETCEECGQPDNCGDCTHGKLTDEQVLDLGGLLNTAGEFRGWDDEGHRVVVAWVNENGMEYLWGLTQCCQATATATEWGIACRACYGECSPSLGADARVVRGPDDGVVVVSRDGYRMVCVEGEGWKSIDPSEWIVLKGEETIFGPASHAEAQEFAAAVTV